MTKQRKADKKPEMLTKKYSSTESSYYELYDKSPGLTIKIILSAQRILDKVKNLPQVIKYPAGIFFLIIGIFGLLLPILPGWILIIPGLALISKSFSLWMERKIETYLDWRKHHPKGLREIIKEKRKKSKHSKK